MEVGLTMKKNILFFGVIGLFLCNFAFAKDNSVRIKELTDEGNKLIEEVAQYQKFIQERQIRIIEIQGALKELSALDKPIDKTEKKEWKKSA